MIFDTGMFLKILLHIVKVDKHVVHQIRAVGDIEPHDYVFKLVEARFYLVVVASAESIDGIILGGVEFAGIKTADIWKYGAFLVGKMRLYLLDKVVEETKNSRVYPRVAVVEGFEQILRICGNLKLRKYSWLLCRKSTTCVAVTRSNVAESILPVSRKFTTRRKLPR